ncbi:MAG TPA: hypothetical protein VLT36_03160 [Candidatus Dormibacteraeota bacterium]|nr:hypothetical protein [Candidatus Dormibacteraeota bacterium]
MRKSVFIAAIIIVCIILALVVRIGLVPPRRPNVSITFRGFTNNSAGGRVGVFAVSNHEPSAVEWSGPVLEFPTPTNVMGQSGQFVPAHAMVPAGASVTLTVSSPANQSSWAVYLRVYPDVGTAREIRWLVLDTLPKIGFKPANQIRAYGIESEWIQGER